MRKLASTLNVSRRRGVNGLGESMKKQKIHDINTPDFGDWVAIIDGLLWTRITIPAKLDHINIYLIRDVDGWFVIDTGPDSTRNRGLWKALVPNLPDKARLSGILVTHSHPDHIGLAGWLQEYYDVPLYISEKEYVQAKREQKHRSCRDYDELNKFYGRMDVSTEELDTLKKSWAYMDPLYGPLPENVNIVRSGDTMDIGGESWNLWSGSGHSIEHLCLQKSSREVLISGDQVLSKITPYVGLSYMSQEVDPLGGWLSSLTDMQKWINPNALILPAHDDLFFDGIKRVREVIDHHHKVLDKLLSSLVQWRTVHDLSCVLGWGEKRGFARCLALEETLAHATYLVNTGKVICDESDPGGVLHYRLA